jgi:hypothetical protein
VNGNVAQRRRLRSIPNLELKIFFGIGVLLVGGCAAYVGWYAWGIAHPDIAIDVASGPDLPPGARHVSYSMSPITRDIRFAISEAEFLAWVRDRGFVDRGREQLDGTWRHTLGEHSVHLHFGAQDESFTITDGLWIENLRMNNGGYVVGYDRKTGIAFWCWGAH